MMTSVERSKQSESSEIDGAQHSIESKSLGIVFTRMKYGFRDKQKARKNGEIIQFKESLKDG